MYNRYIQSDNGDYRPASPPQDRPPAAQEPQGSGFLRGLLGRLKIKDLDTGDLLLLVLLLLLFSEGEDEELLLALVLAFLL